MVRISDILDPELRKRVIEAVADRQGISAAAVPAWYEMDDADYSEILAELAEPSPDLERPDDYRM